MTSSTPATTHLDPRIDAYIAQAAPFARPILAHVRAAMHAALPEAKETIKWGHPFFTLAGKPFANMAAFKAHCALGFWKGGRPIAEAAAPPEGKAMGQFGRVESLADLPSAAALRKLVVSARQAYVEAQAVAAAAPPAPRRAPKEAPPVPDDFAAALRAALTPATKAFAGFTPSQQREYIDWIVEAKRAATRESRIGQAVEWIAEGKTRNWKYSSC
jgi:uncharacterized protein YdeI (YjbR/CyaY-like superfamily)